MITENAPAKINLYLHVTGKREDGYHDLDSLVVFARADEASDQVTLEKAPSYSLRVEGREAIGLHGEDPEKNLITRALKNLAAKTGNALDFAVTLHKNLPIASGIGGGSADAAAVLRGAAKLWGIAPDDPRLKSTAQEIGADVYPCLVGKACYLDGTGHEITLSEVLPRFWLLLVNPHIPIPTADVFRARAAIYRPAAPFDAIPASAEEFAKALRARRNDLQHAACELVEAVADVLTVIDAQAGCLLARMSGSGATCFGLFAEEAKARQAAEHIRRQIGEYWVAVTETV